MLQKVADRHNHKYVQKWLPEKKDESARSPGARRSS